LLQFGQPREQVRRLLDKKLKGDRGT